jgi:DNA-binding CsgD family transcriptional regulator
MGRLTDADLRTLLEFLRRVYATQDLNGFRSQVVSTIGSVVPCEIVGYAEMRPAVEGASHYRFWPPDTHDPARDRRWERHKHEHPVFTRNQRGGDGRALKVSDFLTRNQFHRLALYDEVYRPMGVEDNLVAILPLPAPLIVGIALHRDRRTFAEHHRDMLNLLRPHLTQAYLNAKALDRSQRDVRLLTQALEGTGRGMLFVTRDGRLREATATASGLVTKYFGQARWRSSGLPEVLHRWLKRQQGLMARTDDVPVPRDPLVVAREGQELVVRAFESPEDCVLLLEEQQPALSVVGLEPVGLTRRETQVLGWIAEGKTNAEIGMILGSSRRTVDKHCEHIYRKLGVESRTAAARFALHAGPRAAQS